MPLPGFSQEQTLEAQIGKVLSEVRDDVGTMCTRELPPHNRFVLRDALLTS